MKNALKILLVIVILMVTVYAFNSTSSYSSKEDLQRISETISQLSLKCYSIEGKYPKDINYLKEHYGLLLNDEEYQVIYYYEGENLEPQIEVFKKEKNYE